MPPRVKDKDWSAKLVREIAVKGAPTLRTLADVRTFILALPEKVSQRPAWQRVAEALMRTAETGKDPEAVNEMVENALFLDGRWKPRPLS